MSNGWNKIFFISSSAAPKGAKISILPGVPFMPTMVNELPPPNQASLSRAASRLAGAEVAVTGIAQSWDDVAAGV